MELLNGIRLENGFYPVYVQCCSEENTSTIEHLEGIFDLQDGTDYTYLFAVAELLVDRDTVEAVKDYLLEENARSKEDIPQPGWDEKLLVFTAMEDNPLFFAMAWNWTTLVKQRLLDRQGADGRRPLFGGPAAGESDGSPAEDVDGGWVELLAASTGNTQFGEKAVVGLGTLFIDCREKYGEFFVGLKVNAELRGKNLTVRQRILLKDSGRELVAVIRTGAPAGMAYSQPFPVEELGNPAKGFKYLGEPEIASED